MRVQPFRLLDLPTELIEIIPIFGEKFDQKTDDPVARKIMRQNGPLCKDLLPMYQSIIYETVVVGEEGLVMLYETLKKNPSLGRLIGSFNLKGKGRDFLDIKAVKELLNSMQRLHTFQYQPCASFEAVILSPTIQISFQATLKYMKMVLGTNEINWSGKLAPLRKFRNLEILVIHLCVPDSTIKYRDTVEKNKILPYLKRLNIHCNQPKPKLSAFLNLFEGSRLDFVVILPTNIKTHEQIDTEVEDISSQLAKFKYLHFFLTSRAVLGTDITFLLELKQLVLVGFELGAQVNYSSIRNLIKKNQKIKAQIRLILDDVVPGMIGEPYDLKKEITRPRTEGEIAQIMIKSGWKAPQFNSFTAAEASKLVKFGKRTKITIMGESVIFRALEVQAAHEKYFKERREELAEMRRREADLEELKRTAGNEDLAH